MTNRRRESGAAGDGPAGIEKGTKKTPNIIPAAAEIHRGRYLGKSGRKPIADYTVRVDFSGKMTAVDFIAWRLIRQPPLVISCPVPDCPPHSLTLTCLPSTHRPRLSLICEAGHRPDEIAPLLSSSMLSGVRP